MKIRLNKSVQWQAGMPNVTKDVAGFHFEGTVLDVSDELGALAVKSGEAVSVEEPPAEVKATPRGRKASILDEL